MACQPDEFARTSDAALPSHPGEARAQLVDGDSIVAKRAIDDLYDENVGHREVAREFDQSARWAHARHTLGEDDFIRVKSSPMQTQARTVAVGVGRWHN